MRENRRTVTEVEVLEALAHPVRLDVLNHLMAQGPATASDCARAVGDTPSNCSYHLRVLVKHGLVEAVVSADGRERPYRATVTGLRLEDPAGLPPRHHRATVQTMAASLQLEQRRAREYLAARERVPDRWRRADTFAGYGLTVTAGELADIVERIDAVVRPYLAPTRSDAPRSARSVHVSVQAFVESDRRAPRSSGP